MAIAVGNRKVESIKIGNIDVQSVYLGSILVWPEPQDDIDVEELKEVLGSSTMGYWQDVLPWNDAMPWIDKLTFS